jgi:hypothetical protein
MAFAGWAIELGGGSFANAKAADTSFTMPGADAVVVATYAPAAIAGYLLVTAGCHSDSHGPFSQGDPQTVSVAADVPSGKEFERWDITGFEYSGDLADPSPVVFAMPPSPPGNVSVSALFKDIKYSLAVEYGSGAGLYSAGESALIAAAPPPAGKSFGRWASSAGGAFVDENAASGIFVMPANDVTVTAAFVGAGTARSQRGRASIPPLASAAAGEAAGQAAGQADGQEEGQEAGAGDADAAGGHAPVSETEPGQDSETFAQQMLPLSGDVSRLLDTANHMAYVIGVGDGLFAPDMDMARSEAAQMFYNLLIDKGAGAGQSPFADVAQDAWHRQAACALAALGVVMGRGDGLFHPDDPITRAEFAAIAARFAYEPPGAEGGGVPASEFADVPQEHWAHAHISAAAAYGWIQGVGGGLFGPDRHISRAEAVALANRMLLRSADAAYLDSRPGQELYADVPRSHWAYCDIAEASFGHRYARRPGGGEEEWEGGWYP